jgi:hypothetical protein
VVGIIERQHAFCFGVKSHFPLTKNVGVIPVWARPNTGIFSMKVVVAYRDTSRGDVTMIGVICILCCPEEIPASGPAGGH